MTSRSSLALICLLFCFPFGSALCQSPSSSGEHTTVLNGIRLWYKVSGQPRLGQAPLVFLAGGPGYNSYSFEKTIGAQLERHTQMIYLDERGTGRSERPWTMQYDLATLAKDIETLRRSMSVPKLSLIGHSFGGTVALEYASRYPEHLQKLIIVDGAADIPKTFAFWRAEIERKYPAAWRSGEEGVKGKAYQRALGSGDQCAVTKALFALEMDVLSKPESKDFHHWQQFRDQRFRREQDAQDAASGLRNTGEMSSSYFNPGSKFLCYRFTAYNKLTMPVLVMVGRYDGAVGTEQLVSLTKRLPHAQFDEFDQSAHFPYAEEPVKFDHDVATFLAGP